MLPGISLCAAPRGVGSSSRPGALTDSAVSQPYARDAAQPHSSPPDLRSQGTPKSLHWVSRYHRRDAAPSFNAAAVSLSPCQTSASKRECRDTKSPSSQPCGDPCGASSALEVAAQTHTCLPHHLQATSKAMLRTPPAAWLSHGVHAAVPVHRSHLPTVPFLCPSKTQRAARTVNTLHMGL